MAWDGYPPTEQRNVVHACLLDGEPALWLPRFGEGEGGYVVENMAGSPGIVLPKIAAMDESLYEPYRPVT